MIAFCGIDSCQLDANGRLKLAPRILSDFEQSGDGLVLRCLPEGAIGVYPESVYEQMRAQSDSPAKSAGDSFLYRRLLRQMGALSAPCSISPQGRLSLPLYMREHAGLELGAPLVVAGVEIGIELWNPDRWQAEQRLITEHLRERARLEMKSELDRLRDSNQGGLPS